MLLPRALVERPWTLRLNAVGLWSLFFWLVTKNKDWLPSKFGAVCILLLATNFPNERNALTGCWKATYSEWLCREKRTEECCTEQRLDVGSIRCNFCSLRMLYHTGEVSKMLFLLRHEALTTKVDWTSRFHSNMKLAHGDFQDLYLLTGIPANEVSAGTPSSQFMLARTPNHNILWHENLLWCMMHPGIFLACDPGHCDQ